MLQSSLTMFAAGDMQQSAHKARLRIYRPLSSSSHAITRRCSNDTRTHLQINASSALLCLQYSKTSIVSIAFASQPALPIALASTQAMSLPRRQSKFDTIFGALPEAKRAPLPARRQSMSDCDTPPSTRRLQVGSKPGSLRPRRSFDSNNSEYQARLAKAISESKQLRDVAVLRRHSIDFAMPAEEGDTARRRSSPQTRSTARSTAAPAHPTKVKIPVGRRTASQDSYGFRRDPVLPYTPGSNPYRERTTLKPGLLRKAYNKFTDRLGQLRTR